MKHPTVALFGAQGEMGRYLLQPLLKKHAQLLLCIDRESTQEEREHAWAAECIVLAVPQGALQELFVGRKLRPRQLVIDICSVKKDAQVIICASGAAHLSLHPMNGPHTPWTQQKWIVVGAEPPHPLVQWFFQLLKEKQVLFYRVESAEQHDFLMSVVLGIPEMVTVILHTLLERLKKVQKEKTCFEEMLTVASPAFAALMTIHMHTVLSTPLWLRKELLTHVHPSFLSTCRDVFASMAEEDFLRNVQQLMQEQVHAVQRLPAPDALRAIVREEVTHAFNVMNALFLQGGIKPATELYIQKPCSADTLLQGKPVVRVGIHGIRGAFTDEAWQRFSGEHVGLVPSQYEIFELVHSENVLRAVERGEVDIGIFAFANSGSGGYLASIEAMGKYHYGLLGLFTMPINMCILAHPSRCNVDELRRFYGHPVALSQCRHTLRQRWPDIPIEPATDAMDTALSASELASGKIDPFTGVFASKRAAEIYGLKVLAEGVHHDPKNATAFAVVCKRSE
jgi:prephenate dehydratase/prephenate dehydrogenase